MNPSPLIVTRRDAVRLAIASAGLMRGQVVGPRTEPIFVQCAGLEFVFDPKIAFLRHIKWNGIEVLNGIYVAVRDAVWGTVAPQVSNVIVETEADAFKVVFEVVCKQGEIDFVWNGSIIGAPRALTFEMEGEAKSTFHKNRIGFCVLHPLAGCAGKPLKIDREGNVTVDGKFPDLVSPNQPYIDIRGMRHEVCPGLMAEVRFTGDTFEMEDHRNWTDANFKTYCTPLAKPFPVEVKQGTKIIQSVALRLAGTPKPLPPVWRKPFEVRVEPAANGVARKLPPVGFGFAVDEATGLNAMQAARLSRMAVPAHVRVDLTPASSTALGATLDRVAADLKQMPGVAIEAAVFVTSANAEQELAAVARAVAARTSLKVARWMVFCAEETSTSTKWVTLARKHLKGAPVGGGTNAYFAELNRGRPGAGAMDFASYSMNPQVHAFDDASVMENLGGQADTVRTARQFLGSGCGVVVSPVTLKPRFNPQAKVQQPGAKVDARQSSLFAAAWTVGSLSALLGVADSLTYYETHGAAGLLESGGGGAVFPVFHAFAALAGYAEVVPYAVSDASSIAALGLTRRVGAPVSRLMVANLTDSVQRVRFPGGGMGMAGWRVRILDAETEAEATKKPEAFLAGYDWEFRGGRREMSLLPYAMAVLTQVDGWVSRKDAKDAK